MIALILGVAAPALAQAPQRTPDLAGASRQAWEGVTAAPSARRFLVFQPTTSRSEPAPLLVALHGGMGNARQFAVQSGLGQAGASRGFAVVFPQGSPIRIGPPNGGVWNAGGCCGASRADDVAFIREVVDVVARTLPIDRARVFAVGQSNGGMMAYRLACDAPDLVAAIVPVAATLWHDRCAPARAVSVLHLHGAEDGSVPWAGGRGTGIAPGIKPPVASGLSLLASVGGCPAQPSATGFTGGTVLNWGPCAGGTTVTAMYLDGQGHPWPRQLPHGPSTSDTILDWLDRVPARR